MLTGLYYNGAEPETLWNKILNNNSIHFEAFNLHADKLNKIIDISNESEELTTVVLLRLSLMSLQR